MTRTILLLAALLVAAKFPQTFLDLSSYYQQVDFSIDNPADVDHAF